MNILDCCVLAAAAVQPFQPGIPAEPIVLRPSRSIPSAAVTPIAARTGQPVLPDAIAATPTYDVASALAVVSAGEDAGSAAIPAGGADEGYDARRFFRQARSIPWRFGGAAVAITATGVANWDWGSSPFRFQKEGWFGRDTANMGMDKLGHAYTGYVLTEFFTDGINNQAPDKRQSAYTAGVLAMGLMTYIEVFDGFSKDHGFSHEDMIADAAGVLFSVARRTVPGLREKVDFRLLYTPDKHSFDSINCFPAPHCDRDGGTARTPITDYSNQRYLVALKLAGFERLRRSPARYLELHAGYYARGFTAEEESRGDPLRRRLFVGAGINVGELLFPQPRGWAGKAARSALEYIQLPYTAIHSN